MEEQSTRKHRCKFCGKNFSCPSTLYRHLRDYAQKPDPGFHPIASDKQFEELASKYKFRPPREEDEELRRARRHDVQMKSRAKRKLCDEEKVLQAIDNLKYLA
jgi:hypothetical protein